MFAHRRTVRIEWGDCDAAGIVFYPRYFAMFDASTHHLFEAAGWKKAELRSRFQMVGIPMVDTRAKFLAPSSYGDDIVIETKVAAIRNSSFDVEHRVFKPAHGGETLAIEAFETRVWAGAHPDDPKRLKAVTIPDEVVRRLSEAPRG
jgi:4-hydroxybenzoyl-CoA thioesterase